jgi:POT family proton-dependent oligopeptide transporter
MTETPSMPVPPVPPTTPVPQGHPRGLKTLFFTEMWERFSYYGMRGLLVLFMVDSVRNGMALTDETAAAVYGLYTAAVYLLCLPGGWVADRILGARRTVWYGGIVIATGHFTMALPHDETFFVGLVLVAFGTGMLKPNISAIVGDLYPEGGARRDAGFSIYYMGINLGAFLAPWVCGTLGEKYNWHYGFAAAGVGMVLGLIQFRLTSGSLGDAGLRRTNEKPLGSLGRLGLGGVLAALALVIGLSMAGVIKYKDPTAFSTRDIVNFPAFAAKLKQPADAVSQHLADALPAETRQLLAGSDPAAADASILKSNLVKGLNLVIKSNALYEPTRFAGVGLSPKTTALLATASDKDTLPLLNRRLVEEAYPGLFATHQINLVAVAENTAKLIVAVAVLYFAYVFFFLKLNGEEKKRVWVIVVLFITSALFWAGFEQAGSSFNLFAERFTDRRLSWLNFILPASLKDYEFPASWFQSVGPIFVITLAPIMAGLWVQLGKRNLDPSIPVKFGMGLILLASGFLVMALAAKLVISKHSVMPTWLTLTYLLHTFGELCLSPVGLSSVTKLAPRRLVGQMMGIWFLATSLGNLIAGLFAGKLKVDDVEQMPSRFLLMVTLPIVAGLVVIALTKPIKRLMPGVK